MVELRLTVNDPKTGKSYNKVMNDNPLLNRKVGETVNGTLIGLNGYELKITGGSDSAGFPMRKDIEGFGRKKPLIRNSTGFNKKKRRTKHKAQHHYYLFKRKTVRGNTISDLTAQVNLSVIKPGTQALDQILPKTEAKAEAK